MSNDEIILTTDYDDPDPEGTDVYGFLPLISEVEEDGEDDEGASNDSSGGKGGGGGGEGGESDGEEEPIVEASSIEIMVPKGQELPDDDDDAYYALTAHGATDMSPGEAQDLIDYMRPASEEELAFEEETPFMEDLRWVDDPAHIRDVLNAGKDSKGLSKQLRDTSYGENMKNEEEFADKHDTDDARGWTQPTYPTRRRHRRHHHKHHHRGGQGLQPGQPGYVTPYGALQPGQPGYVAPYGTLQPGQPGYVAPYGTLQPGQPGYVDSSYAAAHAPAAAPTPSPYGASPYGASPYGANPYATATNPYATASNPYATNPYAATTYDPNSPDNYIMGVAKTAVKRGLARKLVVEHANWLADSDKSAGIAVRPRSYYENVAKLWAKDKLKRSTVPITTSGAEAQSPGNLVVGATKILAETAHQRTRFSRALGVETDMGGWNPFSAAKSAVKSVAKYTVKSVTVPLKYGYKYGKKVAIAPLTYTYKGVKYVGKMAEKMALAPLKAIINRLTGTMVTRRANALAKQRGLAAPGPAEKASASQWAKNFVRSKGGKYGSAIASLMGWSKSSEYGVRNVDISMGHDLMGLGKSGVAGLIILGPIGLIALLTGLVKMSGPAAPPPEPGSPEAEAEAAAAAQGAGDGSEEQGTVDAPADYGAQDGGDQDPGAQDTGDSSGFGIPMPRRRPKRTTVTIEQLNRMNPKNRALVQKFIQAGRIRVA